MSTDAPSIKSEADYEAALEECQRLWYAPKGTPEGERLDALATLIDAYEAEHYKFDPPDPVDAILFRANQQGLSREDLRLFIGSRADVTDILNRSRDLSPAMIKRLNEGLDIPVEILSGPMRRAE